MSKKVFVILAEGFELIEAMAPVDVLRRGGVEVITVSTDTTNLEVKSAQNVIVKADTTIDNLDESADMIVLPGGYPGYVNLRENKTVVEFTKRYLESENKFVGAICGAPTLLGVHNLIGNRDYTCHFSVVSEMNSENYKNVDVVEDGNLITSCGAGKAIEFGLALVSKFIGEEDILKLKKGMEL